MWWMESQYLKGTDSGASGSPDARSWVDTGDQAPAAALPAHDSSTVELSGFQGRGPVVLFYYPKANTSG